MTHKSERARLIAEYEQAFRAIFLEDKSKKFKQPGELVMEYLAEICFAVRGVGSNDPYEVMKAEGKREVFYDICKLLKLDYSYIIEYQERIQIENESFFNLTEGEN